MLIEPLPKQIHLTNSVQQLLTGHAEPGTKPVAPKLVRVFICAFAEIVAEEGARVLLPVILRMIETKGRNALGVLSTIPRQRHLLNNRKIGGTFVPIDP